MGRDQTQLTPKPGVSIAVFRDESVLLIRRSKEPYLGAWTLPGGAVEYGETVEGAVRRELLEETGLTVGPVMLSSVLDMILREDNLSLKAHFVLLVFTAEFAGGEALAMSDALEACWHTRDAVASLETTTPKLAEVIEEAARTLSRDKAKDETCL